MKKSAGACSASRPSISTARLPSTRATAIITLSPMPRESTIRAVGAPGRCRLPSARRNSGRVGRGRRRAPATTSAPASRNNRKAESVPPTYHRAILRSAAVKTTSAARPSAAAPLAASASGAKWRRAGDTRSRNSAPGGTCPIAASGHSEKTSVVSRPKIPANASGNG